MVTNANIYKHAVTKRAYFFFLASTRGKYMCFVTGLHINSWQQTNRSG